MRKLYLLFVALLALGMASTARADHDVEVALSGDGEYEDVRGMANIFDNGDGTSRVVITLNNAPDGEHPAHIHAGNCDSNGEIVYPLESVVDGISESEVDASVDELLSEDYYVNVHLSMDEISTIIACGDNFATLAYEGDDDYMPEMPDTGAGAASRSQTPVMGLGLIGAVLAAGTLLAVRSRAL